MTFEPSEPIELTPTMTRVGSGTSARLIALAVAGVLVGVVGFAFVNRPPPPQPAVALATAAPTPEPPPTPLPTPTPPRNQLEGNDGITGWAVVAQLPFSRPGTQGPTEPIYRYTGPRGPGLFNRCRWEVGPQAAPPRGNEDEAGCLAI